MNENLLQILPNEKVYKLNFPLFYVRVILTFFKFQYSLTEAFIELFTCFVLFRCLKQKNAFIIVLYIAFGLFEILFSWIGMVKKLQNDCFSINFCSDDIYFLVVSNISVILYVVAIYFLFWTYQEIELWNEEKTDKEISSNEVKSKHKLFEIPSLHNQNNVGSILPFSNNKI